MGPDGGLCEAHPCRAEQMAPLPLCHTCWAAQNGAKGAGFVDKRLVHHTVLGAAEPRVS